MRHGVWTVWLLAVLLLACEGVTTIGPDPADGDADGDSKVPECRVDADCLRHQKCEGGSCLDICASDRDCGEGFHCDEGFCRALPSSDGDSDGGLPDGDRSDGDQPDGDAPDGDHPTDCSSEGDCDLGFLCIEGRCIPGCRTDRDCPAARVCDTSRQPFGACVQCIRDGQCPQGDACRNNVCKRLCTTDTQCEDLADSPLCDTDQGICVACLSDADCDMAEVCDNTYCVEGCRSNRDCPPPLLCDTEHGAHGGCFVCVTDDHCSGSDVCRNHVCVKDCANVECAAEVPHCLPETGECVACYTKDHCGYGKVCTDFVCVAGCQDDNDCPRTEVCHRVGSGVCVECVRDSDCTGGEVCAQNRCGVQSGCSKDGDCNTGEYCHPNLRTCETIPSGACGKSEDCPLFSLGFQVCDPLTRRCIEPCISEVLCLPLGSGNRWLCVEGYCYECTQDSHCTGVACDPFDWICEDCTSNANCLNSAHHCDTESGNCHECLENSHCPSGKRCKSTTHVCVECLENSHCTNPARPTCGKDNTCIPPCTNQCTSGDILCNPDDHELPICYFNCGDYDNDPCLEWGTSCQSCGSVASCESNQCVCDHQCTTAQNYCDSQDSNKLHQCYTDGYGCRVWSTTTCYYGCANGRCN